MANNIFTKSDDFKSEYCVTCVKIGAINPIEGKDKIGYTLINGETIVVRKDQVKEGDILFYSSNETQLNKDFLGANNLFESSSYELNANKDDIGHRLLKNKELKERAAYLEKIIRKLDVCSNFIISYDAEILAAENDDQKVELSTRLENSFKVISKYTGRNFTDNSQKDECIIAAQEESAKSKFELESVNKEIEENTQFIRTHVGFFNKTGRVRTIRLGGIQSMGYVFSLDELAKYNPKVKDVNLEELVGEDFDTVDGELFVKAYVPFVPQQRVHNKMAKPQRKVECFDRMIKGEFYLHYDTAQFGKCLSSFKPSDSVVITNKLHGMSFICGKVHVKKPIKLPFHKRLWNKFVDTTGLFKKYRVTDYVVEYGNVTSSRKQIKNEYINENVGSGYYGVDIWMEYGNLLYDYLMNGMTVYGEICGYVTGSDKMIQKYKDHNKFICYDYGCEVGKNFLMPYRITTTNEDGSKNEWSVEEVYNWTNKLIENYPELKERIHPINIFYHGTLGELYPDLSPTEHWHENLLERMKNDVEHFGMEKNEPMCKNKVPREGIVIRKDDSTIPEAFKLKCIAFLKKEAELMDDIASGKEKISDEMAEVYA